MANPIIQAIYDLKDNFSAGIRRINDALRSNAKESENTADATERSNARASASYKKTANDIGDLRKALAGVAAFVGLDKLKEGLVGILDVGERFDDLEKEFAAAFGSLEAGSEALAKVRTLAANVPQSLEDVSAAAIALRRAGFDPLDGSLQALIDNQNALGQSQEDLIATIEALGRANLKGEQNLKTLTALSQQGIPVFDLLGKALGASADRVRQLAESGQLGQESIKLLVTELGKLRAGAAVGELGDLDAQLTKVKDTGREFLNTIARSGALDFFREELKRLNAEVADAAQSGKLQQLAKSISDGIVATASAVKSAIGFVVEYSGALLTLGRAYAIFKVADFAAGLARSANALLSASASARKAAGDVDVATGAFGRLRNAIGKVPAQIQFAVTAVAVDFALGQIEKLIGKTQEYLEVQDRLKGLQGEIGRQNDQLAAKARTFTELFKASADVQIASADELANKSRLQSQAYVDQLQNAIRYYTALRVQLRAAGDDAGVAQLTEKLGELGRALIDAQGALDRAGGAIAATTGAFARDAVKAFDAATAAGHDTANALRGLFDKVDLGTPKGARDAVEAIEVIAPRARDARAALEGELLTALQKLDGESLRNFQASALAAFSSVKGAAQDAATVMQAALEAGLTRLGVKASEAGVAITTSGRDIIATFQAVAENVTASSAQIEKAFEAALGKASTKEEAEALGQALKEAAEAGRIGFNDAAAAAVALAQRIREIQAASSPLADDFERLGIKSKAALDAARDGARAAYDAIVEGARRGEAAQDDVRAAFVAYEATARAAVANSSAAIKDQVEQQLQLLASTSGVADAYVALGDAGKTAGDQTAEALRNAAAAADDLADSTNAAASGSQALAAGAAAAASSTTSLTDSSVTFLALTADQIAQMRELRDEVFRGVLTWQQYGDQVEAILTGVDQAVQRQQENLRRFNDELNDLQSQLASAQGDDIEVEDLRHAKKVADIKAETDLSIAQRQALEKLEEQLHEANLKRIRQENDARADGADGAQGSGLPSNAGVDGGSDHGGGAAAPGIGGPINITVNGLLDQKGLDNLAREIKKIFAGIEARSR